MTWTCSTLVSPFNPIYSQYRASPGLIFSIRLYVRLHKGSEGDDHFDPSSLKQRQQIMSSLYFLFPVHTYSAAHRYWDSLGSSAKYGTSSEKKLVNLKFTLTAENRGINFWGLLHRSCKNWRGASNADQDCRSYCLSHSPGVSAIDFSPTVETHSISSHPRTLTSHIGSTVLKRPAERRTR